jgi:hypothetical protein
VSDGIRTRDRPDQQPCDFLTVETAFLQRIYVLFFISLATRRIEYVACSLESLTVAGRRSKRAT